jgi:hypothetical protein
MSNHSELAAAVRTGLEEPNPHDSIRMVKQAVRKGLLAIDKTPSIQDTGYFNHSFTPDFVLQWGPGNQAPSRPVYLKFADDPAYLTEELGLVANQHPLVVELDTEKSQAQHAGTETFNKLQETAQSNDALVTDPDGLTELERGQRSEPILRLLGRALLQGGRGIIDESVAAHTNSSVASGIDAAQRLDEEPIRRATTIVKAMLAGSSQNRVQRFLEALWLGSGGSESDFPGEITLSGALDDDALAFLIETEGVADSIDFWRRIGSRLTVDQLARLPLEPHYFPNLQHLVEANIDRLWARVLKVINHGGQESIGDPDDQKTWWSVQHSLLCLTGKSYTAFIGTLSEQVEKIGGAGSEPYVQDLVQRARGNQIRLGELLLSAGNRFASYGSDDNEDVTDDGNLFSLTASLGSAVRVRSAVAALGSGRHLKINFSRSMAIGEGPAKIPLRELAVTGVPLLIRMPESDARLRDILPKEIGEPTLFDDF